MSLSFFLSLPLQLALIVVSAIGFDFGIQATLVAHQTIIYGIEPEARSRLNALLFTGMFIGMATGAGLGSLAFARWGWSGVVIVATLSAIGATGVRFLRAPTTT
jgi:predicted MFS family arabinose efflux permease